MNTFKYCSFPLLFIILNSPVISVRPTSKKFRNNALLLNEILVTILEKCNLGLQNVFIYDHSFEPYYVKAISTLQPPMIVSIVTKVKFFLALNETLNKNEVQGVIFIMDTHHAKRKNIIEHVIDKLLLTKNCTIIIVPHFCPQCCDVEKIFLTLKELYIFTAYYICLLNSKPVIFTHNVYGEVQPSLWNVDNRKMIGGNMWTLYRRHFERDTICQKFYFDRTNLKKTPQSASIIIGAMSRNKTSPQVSKHNELYRQKLDKSVIHNRDITSVRTLLKTNVKFYLSSQKPVYLHRNTSVDVIFSLYFMSHQRPFWQVLNPINYEEFVILSHHRGFCTPLEKIADFYGFWTISSLTVILIITFFVIWYNTNKNITFATFNLLRLLINNGVNVTMNTLSLKIFFSMIFLYFLVIHSTFSGHLAEFLTKAKLRKNINTVEDALTDSRITDIHNFGFHYSDTSNQEIFDNKSIHTFELTSCIHNVKYNESSACIGFESDFNLFIKRNGECNYYIGNQRLGYMAMSFLYRPRFPFVEKFNYIIIFLIDTKNIALGISRSNRKNIRELQKRTMKSLTDFRKINLKDIQFAFVLLTIGISLGLISFFLELLINHYYNHSYKIK